MSDANSMQVGGNHYASALQHWDVVEDNGIGYLEGCASKYVSRWRKKNGLQDLEKALHFTMKLIELASPKQGSHTRYNRGFVDNQTLVRFVIANDLELTDHVILRSLWQWDRPEDLNVAVLNLQQLIREQAIASKSKSSAEI
jgi:uncharacterized protein DUF3310